MIHRPKIMSDAFSRNMEEDTCELCGRKLSTAEKSNFNFNGLCKTCVIKQRVSYKEEMEEFEKGKREGW